MAAISLANCVVRRKINGEFEEAIIVTPSTANAADTIDLTNLIAGRTAALESVWNETNTVAVTGSTMTATNVTIGGSSTTKAFRVRVSIR